MVIRLWSIALMPLELHDLHAQLFLRVSESDLQQDSPGARDISECFWLFLLRRMWRRRTPRWASSWIPSTFSPPTLSWALMSQVEVEGGHGTRSKVVINYLTWSPSIDVSSAERSEVSPYGVWVQFPFSKHPQNMRYSIYFRSEFLW